GRPHRSFAAFLHPPIFPLLPPSTPPCSPYSNLPIFQYSSISFLQRMKIAVIGLGYVGLPLSFQFARSGVSVLGLDTDSAKVEALSQGKSYIKHIPSEAVAEVLKSGGFSASSDFSRIRDLSAVIICVPTPL